MLRSMTGYGIGQAKDSLCEVTSTIRSVNSKYFDCSCRYPHALDAYESNIRGLIKKCVQRGAISLQVECVYHSAQARSQVVLNEELAQQYWQVFQKLATYLKINVRSETKFTSMLRISSLFSLETHEQTEKQVLWKLTEKSILDALQECTKAQTEEGQRTKQAIEEHLQVFHEKISCITALETDRNQSIKKKCEQRARQYLREHYDESRMAQELFYYIERQNFDEEKQRLVQHLSFFEEILNQKTLVYSKQLIFITQEMNRELNTLGTKSLDAGIQRETVDLKTTLEKIKEQLHNLQ